MKALQVLTNSPKSFSLRVTIPMISNLRLTKASYRLETKFFPKYFRFLAIHAFYETLDNVMNSL